MKFIVDECVGPGVSKWLREKGEDQRVFQKIKALERLFLKSSPEMISGNFIVVTERGIRIAYRKEIEDGGAAS